MRSSPFSVFKLQIVVKTIAYCLDSAKKYGLQKKSDFSEEKERAPEGLFRI
jgi:hypothetical protein